MKVSKIFIEHSLKDNPRSQTFIQSFPKADLTYIDDYQNIFQKVKKPYLQKRDNTQIFIAKKRGQLIKEAPEAYGMSGEPHYYFVHAYNCMYECQYCYLQGYFHSPDLVFFLNHDEIIEEMQNNYKKHKGEKLWFHAGEFSDSLALSHITNEWPLYWDAMKNMPNALLELRTKSANIKAIENLEPLNNVIVSFSFSSRYAAKKFDLKTASISARIKAMKTLYEKGFQLGMHLDPIIDHPNLLNDYNDVFDELFESVPPEAFSYFSLGVVRFTKNVFDQVKKNYTESPMLGANFVTSFDNKVRYSKPLRDKILYAIKNLLIQKKVNSEAIYLCMEDNEISDHLEND